MKTLRNKFLIFLCKIGIHKYDNTEWHDIFGYAEVYLYSVNECKRCDHCKFKKLD